MASPSDAELETALAAYPRALDLRAAASKSSKDLVELDDWYRGELRQLVETRIGDDQQGRAHLTVVELGRLMEWKLARGKWRPRLVQLALSNSDEVVRSVTLESSILPVDKALTQLSTLKGVGPATASAILALFFPSEPFMSDEAMEGVSGGGKAEYTVKSWREYRQRMQSRAKEGEWQMDELEKAYWSWAVLRRYEGSVALDPKTTAAKTTAKPRSGKRKTDAKEEAEEAETQLKPTSARPERAAKKAKAD